MNAQTSSAPAARSKMRKLVIQLVTGALIGALGTFALLTALGQGGFDIDDPARALALLTGLVFALVGAMVGLGLVAPTIGSQLLNVEDADELREQARPLRQGSIVMVLAGVGLMALAVTGVDGAPGVLSPTAGAAIAGLCFVATVLLSFRNRNGSDELMRAVGREASAFAMSVVMLIALVWATLATLGFVPWVSPLGLLAGLFAVQFFAVFAVCAKRGLLMPR